MKIFDYRCDSCGKTIEKMVKTADDVVYCPVCETIMTRLLSAPPVIFKGEGWCKPDGGRSRTIIDNSGKIRKDTA